MSITGHHARTHTHTHSHFFCSQSSMFLDSRRKLEFPEKTSANMENIQKPIQTLTRAQDQTVDPGVRCEKAMLATAQSHCVADVTVATNYDIRTVKYFLVETDRLLVSY